MTPLIHAYYDGELPPAERAQVESHLPQCAACREALAQLRSLSSLLASAAMAPLPAGAMQRIEHSWQAVQDRAVLRIAGWLTAAAAAILLGAMLFVPQQRAATNTELVTIQQPEVWQTVAVMPPTDARDEARAESVVVAQWMTDELSVARGSNPQ